MFATTLKSRQRNQSWSNKIVSQQLYLDGQIAVCFDFVHAIICIYSSYNMAAKKLDMGDPEHWRITSNHINVNFNTYVEYLKLLYLKKKFGGSQVLLLAP